MMTFPYTAMAFTLTTMALRPTNNRGLETRPHDAHRDDSPLALAPPTLAPHRVIIFAAIVVLALLFLRVVVTVMTLEAVRSQFRISPAKPRAHHWRSECCERFIATILPLLLPYRGSPIL